MRTLHYILKDGAEVKTYQEAVASKSRFSEVLNEVPQPRTKASPIRELCLKTFGVVTPSHITTIKQAIA